MKTTIINGLTHLDGSTYVVKYNFAGLDMKIVYKNKQQACKLSQCGIIENYSMDDFISVQDIFEDTHGIRLELPNLHAYDLSQLLLPDYKHHVKLYMESFTDYHSDTREEIIKRYSDEYEIKLSSLNYKSDEMRQHMLTEK